METPASLSFWNHVLSFPSGSDGKESAYNTGDACSILGWGKSPEGGNGNPLRYSCLENSINRGAWRATAHGVAKIGDTIEQLAN